MRSVLDDQYRADSPPVDPGQSAAGSVDPGEAVAADDLFASVEDDIGLGGSDLDDQLPVDEQTHPSTVAHPFEGDQ